MAHARKAASTARRVRSRLDGIRCVYVRNEALGRDVPVWLVPWANEVLTAHPTYAPNLHRLTSAGVTILTADAAHFASSVTRQVPPPRDI
jgi:hypothetical protein